jgi:hypothetical protein
MEAQGKAGVEGAGSPHLQGAAGGDKNKEENVGGGRNGNQKAGNRK